MDKPLISVIVPVYKVEPYIRRCLDSIVGQTYKNLEIILIDDGSPDNCGAICEEYAEKDERVRVIHKENGGVSSARNAGLDIAAGEWIGFVDADDWIEPDMYEYLLGLVWRYDADITQCGAILDLDKSLRRMYAGAELCVDGDIGSFDRKALLLLSNANCFKLYSRNAVCGLCFELAYEIGEDLLFNIEVFRAERRIVFGAEAKYHYMMRSGSACRSSPSPSRLRSYRIILQKIIGEHGDSGELRRHYTAELLRNSLDMCSKIVCFRLEGVDELVRELREEMLAHRELIYGSGEFSPKERLKFFLIARLWPVYRIGLPVLKRVTRGGVQ